MLEELEFFFEEYGLAVILGLVIPACAILGYLFRY